MPQEVAEAAGGAQLGDEPELRRRTLPQRRVARLHRRRRAAEHVSLRPNELDARLVQRAEGLAVAIGVGGVGAPAPGEGGDVPAQPLR